MTHERHPWFKFHASDWRGDTQLRGCSLAARGLWADCLAIMHEAEPRGYLLLAGEPIGLDRLALMVSRPLKEVRAALHELERHHVSSRDAHGRLFSRRMVRDTEKAENAATFGRKGGNPALNPTLKGQVNPELKPTIKPARAHRALVSGDLASSALGVDLQAAPRALLEARFERFWEAYPRHENRKDALRAFTKLNPDHELLATLLDAVGQWKRSRQWREGFAPHAATWLNGERWRDEIPPDTAPSGAFRPVSPPVPDNPKASDLMAARAAKLAANAAEDAAERVVS